jgi:hypothetical protein
MLWRVRNSRGWPLNAPATFIHAVPPGNCREAVLYTMTMSSNGFVHDDYVIEDEVIDVGGGRTRGIGCKDVQYVICRL